MSRRTEPCKACQAPLVFLKTEKKTTMPCDAASVGDDDTRYVHGKHVPHWATCPEAHQFRRKRKSSNGSNGP